MVLLEILRPYDSFEGALLSLTNLQSWAIWQDLTKTVAFAKIGTTFPVAPLPSTNCKVGQFWQDFTKTVILAKITILSKLLAMSCHFAMFVVVWISGHNWFERSNSHFRSWCLSTFSFPFSTTLVSKGHDTSTILQYLNMYVPCSFFFFSRFVGRYLSSSEKAGLNGDSNPDLCDSGAVLASASWAIRPTGSWSLYGSMISL